MTERVADTPHFNASHLPIARNAYVAWLDVMGVRATMARSLRITANFVYKLHIAALESPRVGVTLYPVMDGMYVVADDQVAIRAFLSEVLARTGTAFVKEANHGYQFVVKAAVAYGPVSHGRDLPRLASHALWDAESYRGSLLIGMPMVQAVQSELKAPPFGIYVHESARAFAPTGEKPLVHVWLPWFEPDWRNLARDLGAALESYYDWCNAHADSIEYARDRIAVHRRQAAEYFGDL